MSRRDLPKSRRRGTRDVLIEEEKDIGVDKVVLTLDRV